MEFVPELSGFGKGGKGNVGEPLRKLIEGARRGWDRDKAFRYLTDKYVDKGQMSHVVRSNLLRKVYGRIRLKEAFKKKGKYNLNKLHITTAPPEPFAPPKKTKSYLRKFYIPKGPVNINAEGPKNDKTKNAPAARPKAKAKAKHITTYTGDAWTVRKYGISPKPYCYSETIGRVAPADTFWYALEP